MVAIVVAITDYYTRHHFQTEISIVSLIPNVWQTKGTAVDWIATHSDSFFLIICRLLAVVVPLKATHSLISMEVKPL